MFKKDFILVVLGQIISLFGNAVLRFALPLYLLNQTKSAALFGIISACAFIPMILLAPIGGIFADRKNKRNIMIFLDLFMSILCIIVFLLLGKINLIVLILLSLIILYGIQGAYQPAVQASIPVLVQDDELMSANAIINLVSSIARLLGPVIGGILYVLVGVRLLLIISGFCFLISVIMELFIQIPYNKIEYHGTIKEIVRNDMKISFEFLFRENPHMGKICIFLMLINFFFSTLIVIGLPIIITQKLGFSSHIANQLYGYSEGALAAGGLLGGVIAGTVGKYLKIEKSVLLLVTCSLSIMPIGVVLIFNTSKIISYVIIILCCFIMMTISTLFSIQMMTLVQKITPEHLIGKVMSIVLFLCLLAQPIGQAIYGMLFQIMSNQVGFLFIASSLICILICFQSRKLFRNTALQ